MDHCLEEQITHTLKVRMVTSSMNKLENASIVENIYVIEEGDKGLCPDCVEKETGDE